MSYKLWFPYNNFLSKSKMRLFCFGHSGGVASIFRNWGQHFSPEIEICPLQLPGRETSFLEPLITSMDVLIEKVWPTIESLLDIPCAFFGHSLGAVIAFELAKKLEKSPLKGSLKILFVSSCTAPSLLIQNSTIHLLSDKDFINCIQSYGAMHPQLIANKDAMEVLLPRIRADFSIFETYSYQPTPPLPIPFVACRGNEDAMVPKKNILAWESHTCADFNFYSFSGGHFYPEASLKELFYMISKYLQI